MNSDYKCFLCDEFFSSQKSLSAHIGHHDEISPREYFLKYIGEVTYCRVCEKETRFVSIVKGFPNETCGDRSCQLEIKRMKNSYEKMVRKVKETKNNRYGDRNYNNREKSLKTCIERYGVENPLKLKETIERSRHTRVDKYNGYVSLKTKDMLSSKMQCVWKKRNIKEKMEISNKSNETKRSRGNICGNDEIEMFEIYKRMVYRFTRHNASKIKGIGYRGRGYELDHKFSIFEGFKNNILPSIAGSSYNLEMITQSENRKKHIKCSMGLDELLTSYFAVVGDNQ